MTSHSDGLISLIRRLSYKEGDFTLASGKKSNFYINLKNTTLDPEGMDAVAEQLSNSILSQGHFDGSKPVIAVAGLTLGADPLVTGVSLRLFQKGKRARALIVRKEPKGHGTGQWIEGMEGVPAGGRVIVLEDVVTTGGSGLKAVERLRAAGLDPVCVWTVVDREEGGAQAFREAGLELFSLVKLSQLRSDFPSKV